MFKDKLKHLRIENNLTQADVAKAIGVSPATIGNYEQGTREPRNNEMWQKLANYFGISVDELMDKTNNNRQIIKFNDDRSLSEEKDWTHQFRTDVPIIYNEVDITPLVNGEHNEVISVTREQQFTYMEYTGRSGHVIYARRKLLDIIEEIRRMSIDEISKNLANIVEDIENSVVYWYQRCWNDMDDKFPNTNSLDTLYELLYRCLCIDKIAEHEFTLIPINEDFDWLREKLHP